VAHARLQISKQAGRNEHKGKRKEKKRKGKERRGEERRGEERRGEEKLKP
jgi:hypothetical protein